MNVPFSFIILLSFILSINAQNKYKPKLVVGIVVDQMRYDYLERFYEDFGNEGFKRILKGGTNFTNCKINYLPTVTGAGHASIYTGTTPYFHGVIGNDWKDEHSLESVNCCSSINEADKNYPEEIITNRSPEQLLSSTIGDQIKLNSFGKSKVYSVSIKDRGALLPAGKGANGAFWFNDNTGKFISSFYYYNELPKWVLEFNSSDKIKSYLDNGWDLSNPIENYQYLPNDNSPYEADIFSEGKTSFPHSFKNVKEEELYVALINSPFGNQLVADFAIELLKNENLGQGEFTDHIAISFSSTDKIGHAYGPQSYEVKDTYIRLDKQLAELLKFLDSFIGKDDYLLFLTADHGVMQNTQYLIDHNFDAGVLENTNYYSRLNDMLLQKYGSENLIKTRFSRNIYLNENEIGKLNLVQNEVEQTIKDFLLFNVPEIVDAYTRSELEILSPERSSKNYILNGFNKVRSGDILYSLKANYLNWEHKYGSQHGSRHNYDNHIPLIFYGVGVPNAIKNEEVYIVDIAATICDILGITRPSDCIGLPLIAK